MVDAVVTSLVLRNMLRTKSKDSNMPPDTFDEDIDSNTVKILEGRWMVSLVRFTSKQPEQPLYLKYGTNSKTVSSVILWAQTS